VRKRVAQHVRVETLDAGLPPEHGWTVHHENAKGYLQMRCGCGRHLVWLHKTPSNPNHFREKVAYMIRVCSTGPAKVP
jgi:hypothetical protein